MSSDIKDSLTEQEQKALIRAKTLKPSLQFDLVNSKPETKPVAVKSPANNTNSAPSSPPHASVKPAAGSGTTTPNQSPNSSKESSPTSSPLSTSPEKAGNKPPVPPKRMSSNPSKETSESTAVAKSTAKPSVPPIRVSNSATGESSTITTSTKVATHRQPPSSSATTPQPTAQPRDIVKLKEWEEKLHDSTVEGKPAYTALLEYLILNPDKSLEEGVEHVRDLRFKELKIEFKNKKIHGLLIPLLMEYYHSLYPKALNSEIFELLRELRGKEKPSDELLFALKEFEKTYKE